MAAAILGDMNKIEFVSNPGRDRFTFLASNKTDLLVSQVTHTIERDIYEVSCWF